MNVTFEKQSSGTRNEPEFFKQRNLATSRSALDYIGLLGELGSKTDITEGDVFKYKAHLLRKCESTNQMFFNHQNRYNRAPKRNLGNGNPNMLEVIREGKDNFLIPLARKQSLPENEKCTKDVQDSYQTKFRGQIKIKPLKLVKPIMKLNSTRNTDLEPIKNATGPQEQEASTLTNL
jgi:hypothetical protein